MVEVWRVTWALIKITVPVWTFVISSKSVQIACADSIRERTGRRFCRRCQPCASQSHSAITPRPLQASWRPRHHNQINKHKGEWLLWRSLESVCCALPISPLKWLIGVSSSPICLFVLHLERCDSEMQIDKWFWWISLVSVLGKVYVASAKPKKIRWICKKHLFNPNSSINYPKYRIFVPYSASFFQINLLHILDSNIISKMIFATISFNKN